MIQQHSAGGVIIDGQKVLTISWTTRHYIAFPKGLIDEGESSEQAALREVFEETGYSAKIVAPLGSWTYDFSENGKAHHKTVDYYLMERVDDKQPTPHRESGEDFENLWLELDVAREALSYDDSKEALDAALAQIRKAKPIYAGLLANEARYFKNKYNHDFVTKPIPESKQTLAYVETILKQERGIQFSAKPVEVTQFQTGDTNWAYVFYEDGLVVNVLYTVGGDTKRAVGFKLSEGMPVPKELEGKFRFARQKSKLAGVIRGSYFVIKGEYKPLI